MDHYSVLNIFSFFLLPKLNWFTFWSETLGTLTDWTGANYSTIICNLAGRHLGLLSCRRRGINTSLLFRRKDFSRLVMYYSNSNAIFQHELLIICGDVKGNLRPVSKRNQARSTAPTCHAVAINQRRFVCWMCHDMTHVTCSKSTADSRVFSASSPVSWTCNRCAFASLPIFEESSSDDFNALTFSSDESSKDVQLSDEEFSTILMKYSKNLKIGHININRVASFNFFELRSLILKSLFDLIVGMINNKCKMDHSFPDSHFYIKGFRLYREDRHRFGGGVFIYIRRGLRVTKIHDLERHEVESITLCVQTPGRAKKVIVIGIYRPPGLLKATWEHEINSILLRSTQRYESIMLIGDLH